MQHLCSFTKVARPSAKCETSQLDYDQTDISDYAKEESGIISTR